MRLKIDRLEVGRAHSKAIPNEKLVQMNFDAMDDKSMMRDYAT